MQCPGCAGAMTAVDAGPRPGHQRRTRPLRRLPGHLVRPSARACGCRRARHCPSSRPISERKQGSPNPAPRPAKCPRCGLRLLLTDDRQRNTTFSIAVRPRPRTADHVLRLPAREEFYPAAVGTADRRAAPQRADGQLLELRRPDRSRTRRLRALRHAAVDAGREAGRGGWSRSLQRADEGDRVTIDPSCRCGSRARSRRWTRCSRRCARTEAAAPRQSSRWGCGCSQSFFRSGYTLANAWRSICWSSALIPTISKSALAARSRATRRRASRRALRPDAGEMSSNGTPDGAAGRGGRGGARARRRLAREPRLARRRHRSDAGDHVRRSRHHPPPRPRASRSRTGTIGIPITSPPATCCAKQCSTQRPAPISTAGGEPWRPDWLCYYFINDSATPSFVVDVSAHYEQKRQRSMPRQPVRAARRRRRGDAADGVDVPSAVESRDAQFGALAGVRSPKASSSASRCARRPAEAVPMNIGMVCYASVGGSGVVATELAHALALRGHHGAPDQQRAAVPPGGAAARTCRSAGRRRRLTRCSASRSTCSRWRRPSPASPRERRLDIVHAHYAVPHATAAYLAYQMLDASCGRRPRCRGR